MKKLIFRNLAKDTLIFFLIMCFAVGTIVWTIQAVNYFDYVSQDGHGLKTYFTYILLNFPKIISGKRGLGLIQGLVINQDYADAKNITLKAFDKGLLVVPAGGNVIRIVPPLIISRREINILLDKLNSIFKEI